MYSFDNFREQLYACTLELLGPTLGRLIFGLQ